MVKSIFSSELQRAAERLEEVSAVDEEGNDRIAAAPSANPSPDAHVIVDQLKEQILTSFEQEEDQLVLLCLFDGVTAPVEIAEATGILKKDVNRIKQKIKRRLVDLKEET